MRPIDADALMRMICGNECGCAPEECGIEEKEYDACACNYCGYIEDMPTIEAESVNRAAILRLGNEIEMIIATVCDTGYTLQDCDVEAVMKRTKAIRKELTGDAEPVRHGRWVFREQKSGYLWKCSNCKREF